MGDLKIGDRVTVTVNDRKPFHGVITGEGRDGLWWLIVKDGTKSPNGYHKDFCSPQEMKHD